MTKPNFYLLVYFVVKNFYCWNQFLEKLIIDLALDICERF